LILESDSRISGSIGDKLQSDWSVSNGAPKIKSYSYRSVEAPFSGALVVDFFFCTAQGMFLPKQKELSALETGGRQPLGAVRFPRRRSDVAGSRTNSQLSVQSLADGGRAEVLRQALE